MNADPLAAYREIWAADFEFHQPPGELPTPLCLVAHEIRTGRTLRLWHDELPATPPFPVDERTLFVAYYVSAEMGCFLQLGWPLPLRILDLFVEFKCLTSGLSTPCGSGLLGAMTYFGLGVTGAAAEKDSMRNLAIRGGPFTDDERQSLLTYCGGDVDSLVKLLRAMLPHVDLPRALLRGRYMCSVAKMERTGVPIDVERLATLRQAWPALKRRLILEVDRDFHVFHPTKQMKKVAADASLSFSAELFGEYLVRHGIPSWPHLPTGRLALSDNVFKDMSKAYPQIAPLRELRHALSEMKLEKLAVGVDGRNRTLLSPFGSRTGRNQPSNTKFIFGPAVWLRSLIKPTEGMALAYIDWSQQEFGIAAALSGDTAMMAAYASGDPYLQFGKQAGVIPSNATRQSHGAVRELFKTTVLAVQYGMSEYSLGARLGIDTARARELLRAHRHTYPTFWAWSQAAVDHAMLGGSLCTVFGWQVHTGPDANPRSLANFCMQGNGSEMLRLACCLMSEGDIRVAAPIHDAVLIEAPIESIVETVTAAQSAMAEASRIVLGGGFELRSDVKVIRHPDRYSDPRGVKFWNTVWRLIDELESPPTSASLTSLSVPV